MSSKSGLSTWPRTIGAGAGSTAPDQLLATIRKDGYAVGPRHEGYGTRFYERAGWSHDGAVKIDRGECRRVNWENAWDSQPPALRLRGDFSEILR